MRRWPLKWYIVFLTCFKTKGRSAYPLPISCRSVCHGTYASAERVLWLACSVFIFYPCEYSEASGINLMDKSICESRNRLSNPQNLVLVQFKLKKRKVLERGHIHFGSASWVQRSPWGGDVWFLIKQNSSYRIKSISFSLSILNSKGYTLRSAMLETTWLLCGSVLFKF